ncbi:glycosyltransferase family 39 protein [Candidatus Gottesmanbacteria bacterium]|nr:glycosyltransferase family 39 protein [Candidatus Gottesmanbacteria bacterium]
MYIQLKKQFKKVDIFLFLAFIGGLIPAFFLIHIAAVDFSGFYFQAISFLEYKGPAYQIIMSYCDNPINTGVNSRAPVVPLLMALSMSLFDKTLLGVYIPFFLAKILILPLTYLVAKHYLPKRFAFFCALLLLFIPKLQTYSFAALEADLFIALFYCLALYFYLKSDHLSRKKYLIASTIALSLGALTKSTGFTIALGFIAAIIFENIKLINSKQFIKNLYIYSLVFIILVGPYLLWTTAVHHQLYLSTHKDKSISYILTNLPSLIETIPLYLGISFLGGIKAKLIALILLLFLILGIIKSVLNKWFVLTLPTLATIILISTLSTCLIGGNIPASLEFITILGFSMIPTSILLFIGIHSLKNKIPLIFIYLITLLIVYKFINNYFTSPYTLEYIPSEYYISIPTIIKNRQDLPDVTFKTVGNLRIFQGPIVHREIKEQFTNYRFKPFSSLYKKIIYTYVFLSLIAIFFVRSEK